MTDCKELFAVLSEYLDAELPGEDCAAIEAHLAGCPPCLEFIHSLKQSIELCRSAGGSQAPPPLTDEVRQRLLDAYQQVLASR